MERVEVYHRIVRFVTVGLPSALRAREAVEALPDIRVLHIQRRELGFLERQRLFAKELQCTLVLEVSGSPALSFAAQQHQSVYRGVSADIVMEVRPDLAEVLETLEATTAPIRRAQLQFETRGYEPELLERLAQELQRQVGEHGLAGDMAHSHNRLYGRIAGDFEGVHAVSQSVRRSGLCDPDAVRVAYE